MYPPAIEAARSLFPLPSLGWIPRYLLVDGRVFFVGQHIPSVPVPPESSGKLIAAFKPGYQGWQTVQGDKRQLQDSPARASEDCVAHGANGET